MNRLLRGVALLPVLLLVALPCRAATAREMYAAATARQQALHAALARGGSPVTARQYRGIVAAFEAIVRRHPGTGYADNALWEGARLAGEAYDRFGDERDRAAAVRLFSWLVKEYPTSPLVGKARQELKRTAGPPRLPAVPPRERTAEGAGAGIAPARSEPRAEDGSPAGPTVLRDIRRTLVGDVVRVTIQLDEEVSYRSERVENPPRVLFDLAGTRIGPAVLEGTTSFSGDVVRHVRVGRHPNQVTRVVVDLDAVKRYSVFTLYNPYRIVVDCERDRTQAGPLQATRITEERLTPPPPEPDEPAAVELPGRIPGRVTTRTIAPPVIPPAIAVAAPPAAVARPLTPLEARRVFRPTRLSLAWQPVVHAPPPIALPPPAAAAFPAPVRSSSPPAPAAKSAAAPGRMEANPPPAVPPNGYSLARQLGLGASRIVIDPGHGGHDPGAEGPGVFEATIVLDVALRLEKLLTGAGSEVILTRRADEYVQLEERTAIANRAQGDLFLSIHANASRNRAAKGVESYFLNFATNPEAEAVAARENAATGRTMSSLTDIVKAIALNNKLDESKNFAALVQRQMVEHLKSTNKGLKNHGVKQAPFVVLIGASMPSVLVEVSFITNSQEGRLLKSAPYRQRIAEALFDAVRGYQKSLKGASVPASQ